MGEVTATVEALTAEVRALMIGSRQVTLSVYRQLDTVPHEQCEPFGRVRDSKDEPGCIWVVGRDTTGALIRSKRYPARDSKSITISPMEKWASRGVHDTLPRKLTDGYVRLDHVHAGVVAVDGDDQVCWMICDYDYRGYYASWDYISPEAQLEAERLAGVELEQLRKTRRLYSEWLALPLIVLAGLR